MRDLVTKKRGLASKLAARLGTWLRSHKATSKLGQLLYSDVKAARDAYVRLLGESREAQGKGETRRSVERTSKMSWKEQVKNHFSADQSKQLLRNDTLVLSPDTPSVTLKDVKDNLPLAIPRTVITKATNGKDASHSISRGNIKYLDSGLDNMIASIYEPDYNSFVIVTDLEENGKPIVIPFLIDQVFDGDRVHIATSIHSKQNFVAYIEHLENATVRVINKNKFDALARKDAHSGVRVHESTELVYEDNTTPSAGSQEENSDNIRHSYESDVDEAIDRWGEESDISPQQRKANERWERDQDRALEEASRIESEPEGYRGMSDGDVKRAEDERDFGINTYFGTVSKSLSKRCEWALKKSIRENNPDGKTEKKHIDITGERVIMTPEVQAKVSDDKSLSESDISAVENVLKSPGSVQILQSPDGEATLGDRFRLIKSHGKGTTLIVDIEIGGDSSPVQIVDVSKGTDYQHRVFDEEDAITEEEAAAYKDGELAPEDAPPEWWGSLPEQEPDAMRLDGILRTDIEGNVIDDYQNRMRQRVLNASRFSWEDGGVSRSEAERLVEKYGRENALLGALAAADLREDLKSIHSLSNKAAIRGIAIYDRLSEEAKLIKQSIERKAKKGRGAVSFTEKQKRINSLCLQEMKPVTELTGKELDPVEGIIPSIYSGESLNTRIAALFNMWNNVIHTDAFGDVSASKSSVRSEIRHGLTTAKVSSFAAIPAVLQNGVVIDVQNKGPNNLQRIVVAAPIKIGKDMYYMGVMLQRDDQNQRLYIHDVVSYNKEELDDQPGILNTTGPAAESGELFLTSIIQNALDVKSSVKIIPEKQEVRLDSGDMFKDTGGVTLSTGFLYEGRTEEQELALQTVRDLIKVTKKKQKLTEADMKLAMQISNGERDVTHIPDEAKTEAIMLVSSMYEAAKTLTKDSGASALASLGIAPAGAMVRDFRGARGIVGIERARQQVEERINEVKKQAERDGLEEDRVAELEGWAMGLAAGSAKKSDFRLSGKEWKAVDLLTELIKRKNALAAGGAGAVRAKIMDAFGEKLFEGLGDLNTAKKLAAPITWATTFIRNNRSIWGKERGDFLNDLIWQPEIDNEVERQRFEKTQTDAVYRLFGHFSRMESAVTQFMIESGIGSGNLNFAGIKEQLEFYLASIEPTTEGKTERQIKKQTKSAEKQKSDVTEFISSITQEQLFKCARLADYLRAQYKLYYDAINEFLVMHGYKPIGFIENYAPHMQSDEVIGAFNRAMKRLGIGEYVFELPSEIAGRTDTFRPGHKFDPHFQHRAGNATAMDAIAGYTRYVHFMSEVFYHTDDIQKMRQLSQYIRSNYADSTITTKLEEAKTALIRGDIDDDQYQTLRENALKDKAMNTNLSDYVSKLDDYANKIAGKQTVVDRGPEHALGRPALNVANKIENAFSASAIVGNISSALNQTVQLPLVIAECGVGNFMRACQDIANGNLNSTMDFDYASDFITGKRQGSREGVTKESIRRTIEAEEKFLAKFITGAKEIGQIPFEVVDDLSARIVVRTKYFELINTGIDHETALKRADQFANSVVGSRVKGAKPLMFESKNPFVRLLTMFQLEPMNLIDHFARDVLAELKFIKQEAGMKAMLKVAGGRALRYFLTAFLLNRLFDELFGRTPVPFDVGGTALEAIAAGYGVSSATMAEAIAEWDYDRLEDKEYSHGAALKELFTEIIPDDLPFVQTLYAMTWGDSSKLALPNFKKLINVPGDIKEASAQIEKKEQKYKEHKGPAPDASDYLGATWRALDGVWSTAKTLIPFGNQLNKTLTGLTANIRGGGYDRKGNLMYPQSWGTLDGVTSIVFGSGANDRAGDYFASGYDGLSERETAAYRDLTDTGMDHDKAFDLIRTVTAFAPDEAEREPSVAPDVFTWYKEEYLYKNFMSEKELDELESLRAKVEKQIEYLDSVEGVSDEQKLIAFRELCADKKIAGALRRIRGEDDGELYGTVRDVVMTKYDNDSEKTKAQIIADSSISDKAKGELWLVTAASTSDAVAAEKMYEAGEEIEDVYRAYAGVSSAKSAAKEAGAEQAKAGRAAIADSSLSAEAKYDMYISSYNDNARAPEVMRDWIDNGASKAQAVKWMTAYDSAEWIGNEAYKEKLGDGKNCENSAGGATAARMEALLGQGMTGRELEVLYFGLMCDSGDEEKKREQFDALHDAGGTAVDYFEAYVAVSKATWAEKVKNAKSQAIKDAIDSTGATAKVKKVLYEIFGVAKSVK